MLTEFLGVASLITIGLGALRAGIPGPEEASALVCTLLVVLLQVVGASMRWSLAHPYPVDLRSARATPAPPAAMVGYSARLATCTTFTSLIFSGAAHVPDWRLSVLLAIPCLLWSGVRFERTARRWQDPVARALVVTTTAADRDPTGRRPSARGRRPPALGSEHGLRSLPRAADLTARVADFMATEIDAGRGGLPPRPGGGSAVPATPGSRSRSSRSCKAKARAQGLWNLFLPQEHAGEYAERFGTDGGEGLTNVDYAPLAEQMGRSAIAPLRLQLQRPRHRQHGGAAALRHRRAAARVARAAARRPDPLGVHDDRARASRPPTPPTWRRPRVVDGDEVVVNGRKWWSTGVGHPDCKILVFMGLTDPDADRHHRHSMVLVPRDTPGVKVERLLTTMGMLRRAARPRRGVASTDVRVPLANIMLGPGRGPSRSPRAGSARAGCTTACG